MTTEHTTEVVTLAADDGGAFYFARCSCGWKGTSWESRELAQASANGHYVFPEMVVTA